MKKIFIGFIFLTSVLCAPYGVFAQTQAAGNEVTAETADESVAKAEAKAVHTAQKESRASALHSIDFLTGYAIGHLNEQESHELLPLIVDFNFDLKKITDDWNWKWDGMLLGFVEGFAGIIGRPDSNFEFGTDLGFKVGILNEEKSLQPYLKAGIGIMYMTLQTIEQGTQFNFNEFAGVGLQYRSKDNRTLLLEYRYRHLSNAGIDESNGGINDHFFLAGFSLPY